MEISNFKIVGTCVLSSITSSIIAHPIDFIKIKLQSNINLNNTINIENSQE